MNWFLAQQQSGFCPGEATVNQLLSITQNIYKAFEVCPTLETRPVFLCLSKVFNRVWHMGPLFKLKCNGINGNLFTLIESYLADRKQRVLLNGKCSEWAPICAGASQGSVLGPLFFLVCVNGLIANLKFEVKMFADDTSLFKVVDDVASQLMNLMQILIKFSYGHGSGRYSSMQLRPRKLSSLV